MHHRDIWKLSMETFGVDAGPLPEAIESPMLPLLVDVVLVLRDETEWRVTALPGHAREPGPEIYGFECREQARVLAHRGTFQPEVVGPGHLFQLEGAALTDSALVGVGEATAVDIHCL